MTKKRRGGLCLIALSAILLLRGEIRPQTTSPIIIEGIVREAGTEQPAPEVKVTADAADGGVVEAVTDAGGLFTLTGVASGPQRILTEKAGFTPAKPDGRTIPGNPGVWLTSTADKPLKNVVLHIAKLSGISGRVVDRLGHPLARVEVYAARYAYDVYGERHLQPASAISNVHNGVTNDAGDFRIVGLEPAAYYVVVQPPLSAASVIPGEAFAPVTYYPSVTDVADAKSIEILPGNSYRLPAITLASVPAGKLRIHLVDPAGKSHAGALKFIALQRKGDEGQSFALGMKAEAYGGPDYVDLGLRAPGRYDVEIGWLQPSGLAQALTRTVIDLGPAGVSLELPIVSGPSITGRALISQAGSEPLSVSSVQYSLLPKTGGLPIKGMSDFSGAIESDAVPPGTYHIAIAGLTPDVYLQSVDESNSAISSDHITVGTEDIHMTFQLGRTGGTLDGHVSDSKNRKASGASIVLAPDAPFRANGFLYRTAVSDQDGAFRLRSVAPGSYHLFAWTELEGAPYRNADFMTQYERSGKPVTIKNNDKQSVDVRLADDPRNP